MSDSMGNVVEGTAKEVTGGGKFAAASPGVFISPWTSDSNQTDHATVFQHGLGVVPQSILVLFSPDQVTVYPIHWPWAANLSGNPVTISMNATTITLNIFSGNVLHGVWSPGSWTTYAHGYWMVIAKASA
jgi:hypothetical protein